MKIVVAPNRNRNRGLPIIVDYNFQRLVHLIAKYKLTEKEWTLMRGRVSEIFEISKNFKTQTDIVLEYNQHTRFQEWRADVLKRALADELRKFDGNVSETARYLGVFRKTLYRYITGKEVQAIREECNGKRKDVRTHIGSDEE